MATIKIDYIAKEKNGNGKTDCIALINETYIRNGDIYVYGYIFHSNFIGELEYDCGRYYAVEDLLDGKKYHKCYTEKWGNYVFPLHSTNEIMGLKYGMDIRDDGDFPFDYAFIG